MSILIAYYSRSGNTEKVAQLIQKKLNCDIEEVIEDKNHNGAGGYLKGAFESVRNKGSSIKTVNKNPSDYDLIIIGSPVWASGPASPMITYLEENKDKIKDVAIFATFKGSGQEKLFNKVEKITSLEAKATLGLSEKELDDDEKISQFVSKLQ